MENDAIKALVAKHKAKALEKSEEKLRKDKMRPTEDQKVD